MNILIVNPPFYRLQGEMLVHYPPGCCYVAGALEQAGFESLIYNADYAPRKKTILGNTNHLNVEALLRQHEVYQRRLHDPEDPLWVEIRDYLRRAAPDVLIVSVFSTTLTAGTMIAGMARQVNPAVRTIFEGSVNRGLHCAIDPAECGDFSVMEFAIRKEPEETAVELVRALAAGATDFSAIRGLSWRAPDGRVVHNPERDALPDLDRLPFPARHRLDGWREMPPHGFQGIYGSRGCPFDCVFCGCHTSMGYRPRVRSARNMVDEIEMVHRRFGTRYFYICDDIFFIHKERAREFCRLLSQRQLPVYWSAQTRAEMVDGETLDLAREAGCQHIAVGVEVGNPRIRELLRKGNTVDDVRRCSELIRKHGLRMVAFCIVGLPWESRQEIEDTVNLVKEIKPYIVYPYMPTPAAGTELVEILGRRNPGGLEAYRDQCHIDPAALRSERMAPEEKRAALSWAMGEFVKLNKRRLGEDVFRRPGFYWALAHDMGFFRHPGQFLSYVKDYLS